MDRVLVEVSCPATGRRYDFWIPKKMTVRTALEKLCGEIASFEDQSELWEQRAQLLLCSCGAQKALNPLDTVFDAGVRSGDTLMLV